MRLFSRERAAARTRQPVSCERISADLECVCVKAREGEWWKGRADSDAPLNTDERKASWILIRLLASATSLSLSLRENSSEDFAFLNRWRRPAGQPFNVKVQVIKKSSYCSVSFIWRSNKRLILMMNASDLIVNWNSLEAEFVSIFYPCALTTCGFIDFFNTLQRPKDHRNQCVK